MENTKNNNSILVNFLSDSTTAVYQNYSEPTVNTDSLSFKIKNNFYLAFSLPETQPPEQAPKIEIEEKPNQ